MAQKNNLAPDAFLIGFIFIFMLLLMVFSGCKHAPQELPVPISQTNDNGQGNNGSFGGNANFGSTCSADTAYFDPQILPMIRSYCATAGCHNPTDHAHDIILDSYQNIMAFGDVEQSRPLDSKFWEALTATDPDDRMPPADRPQLSSAQMNLIYTWLSQGAQNNICTGNCDTSDVRFSSFIQPFINNYCVGCHSGNVPGGNIRLTNYPEILAQVTTGKLLGSIRWDNGIKKMPKGASTRLNSCMIDKVDRWIQNGAQNN